jgi:transposase
MQTPEDVQTMLKLASLGWGAKRISRELGCSRNTVRSYLRQGAWQPYQSPRRPGWLAAHQDWLADRFRQHRGNCDVVRQQLQREHGITVSLRTVERAVAHLRRDVLAQTAATVRFETPPGQQLQIDFGTLRVPVGEEQTKIHLFVATLGYSRRTYVAMFLHERQSAWLQGLEDAFRHFGGMTREVLIDNARALVTEHDAQTREVAFNDRFHAFCRYWGVTPRACAPYRARTKGKDERGVGYVKRNAIAGHRFASLEELEAHLARWMREVADVRIHGTTAEPPIDRFERDERSALTPLASKAPFLQVPGRRHPRHAPPQLLPRGLRRVARLRDALEHAQAGRARVRAFAGIVRTIREIADMVQRIQDGTRGAIQSMESSLVKAGSGVDLAGCAGEAIGRISNGAREVVQAVSKFSSAVDG